MNLRNVLRAYSLLRQLSDDETALLETLRAANDSERQLIVEALSDKPPQKKSERVIERCNTCHYTRRAVHHNDPAHRDYHSFDPPLSSSKKAAGSKSKQQSKRELSLRRQIGAVVQGSGSNLQPRCIAMIDDNGGEMECGETIDNNVHHKQTDPGYHEFQPGKSLVSTAGGRSSANGADGSTEVNSETQPDGVSNVHRAGG